MLVTKRSFGHQGHHTSPRDIFEMFSRNILPDKSIWYHPCIVTNNLLVKNSFAKICLQKFWLKMAVNILIVKMAVIGGETFSWILFHCPMYTVIRNTVYHVEKIGGNCMYVKSTFDITYHIGHFKFFKLTQTVRFSLPASRFDKLT